MIAILGMAAVAIIHSLNLERTQPYVGIMEAVLGFILGTLLTGLLYASRYISKVRAYKARLLKKLRGLN